MNLFVKSNDFPMRQLMAHAVPGSQGQYGKETPSCPSSTAGDLCIGHTALCGLDRSDAFTPSYHPCHRKSQIIQGSLSGQVTQDHRTVHISQLTLAFNYEADLVAFSTSIYKVVPLLTKQSFYLQSRVSTSYKVEALLCKYKLYFISRNSTL